MKYIILNLPSEVREHQYLEFELGMNQDIADIFDSASFVTHPPYGGGSGIDGNDRFIPLSGDDGDSATVSPADSIAGTAILRAEGELLSRSVYYADGTRAVVCSEADSSRVRYIGSMVYVSTPDGEEALSGIVTADGYIDWRGNATDSQMQYFLRDHLGSVRVVATDRNNVISRRDYLPSGVQMTGNGLTTDYSNGSSRYGFSGKENEREGSRYLHFEARTYDPVGCIFLQTDPLAEKFYDITPYSYCGGNPVMYVDPDGLSWVFNKFTGQFVEYIDDGDDCVYMYDDEQIKRIQETGEIPESDRGVDGIDYKFGQMVLNGELDFTTIDKVLRFFLEEANKMDENGSLPIYALPKDKFITDMSTDENIPFAQVEKIAQTITAFPYAGGLYYEGYGIMLLFVHELAHLREIENGTLSDDAREREQSADGFVENHWVYGKATEQAKLYLGQHKKQENGK